MAFLEKISVFLKNVQKQPESTRKIILWSAVIIIGLGLFFLWLHITENRLKNFQKGKFFENIGTPNFQKEIKNAPAMEVPATETPQLSEEELKELEKLMEEAK